MTEDGEDAAASDVWAGYRQSMSFLTVVLLRVEDAVEYAFRDGYRAGRAH